MDWYLVGAGIAVCLSVIYDRKVKRTSWSVMIFAFLLVAGPTLVGNAFPTLQSTMEHLERYSQGLAVLSILGIFVWSKIEPRLKDRR